MVLFVMLVLFFYYVIRSLVFGNSFSISDFLPDVKTKKMLELKYSEIAKEWKEMLEEQNEVRSIEELKSILRTCDYQENQIPFQVLFSKEEYQMAIAILVDREIHPFFANGITTQFPREDLEVAVRIKNYVSQIIKIEKELASLQENNSHKPHEEIQIKDLKLELPLIKEEIKKEAKCVVSLLPKTKERFFYLTFPKKSKSLISLNRKQH